MLLIVALSAVIVQAPAKNLPFSSFSSYHCSNSSVTYEAFASSFSDISYYLETSEKDRTTPPPSLLEEYIRERENDSDDFDANYSHNQAKTSLQQTNPRYLLKTVVTDQDYGIISSKQGFIYPLYILFSSLKISPPHL